MSRTHAERSDAPSPAPSADGEAAHHPLLALQRTAGNTAVASILRWQLQRDAATDTEARSWSSPSRSRRCGEVASTWPPCGARPTRSGRWRPGPGWHLDIPVPAVRDEGGDRVVIQVAVDAHHGKQILPVEVYGVADHIAGGAGALTLSDLSRRTRRG